MATLDGLQQPFRTQVEQLLAAADGRITVASGYRTYAQQLELRKTNGCPDPLHSPPDACRIPTAIPGTSQHEKGLAVDFGGDLDLAAQLGPTYGIARPRRPDGSYLIPSEPWHFEPIPGWAPPPAPPAPNVQEDDDMLIQTPAYQGAPSMLVHLHQGKLIWIRRVDPETAPPWTLDLRGDPDTWHTYLNLFGPVA